jgi:hypothetical protein
MSDRLKFFREQMAAFEGASNPQKAIEHGYYIQQPKQSLAHTITNRIALRPSSTRTTEMFEGASNIASSHLLIGGIVSGKTTQLLVARDRINEIEDTHAHYVDVSLYTDISDLSTGMLIAIVGLVLCELTKDNEDLDLQQWREAIRKQAYGYSEKKVETKDLLVNSIFNS